MFDWSQLSTLTQTFFIVAVFCTVFLVAQIAVSGSGDADTADADGEGDHAAGGASSVGDVMAHALLSLRSLLAFTTLFSWAAGLYLRDGATLIYALSLAAAWGLGGSFLVAAAMAGIRWAHAPGTEKLAQCVGKEAVVTLSVGPGATGEVKLLVGGRMQHVRARGDAQILPEGTRVFVLEVAGPNTLHVVHARQIEGETS